jgi:hypothetical protein
MILTMVRTADLVACHVANRQSLGARAGHRTRSPYDTGRLAQLALPFRQVISMANGD